MKYLKHALAGVVLGCAFMAGYGTVAHAFPAGGILGRGAFQGYHTGIFSNTNLTHVFPIWYNNGGYGAEAMPGHINSSQEFIDFILSYLYSGDPQRNTGASFIIYTMTSTWSWSNSGRIPPQSVITTWDQTVRTAVAQGSVTWRHWWNTTINSAYQRNINDATWFDQPRSSWTMVFGWGAYAIRWECANPVNDRAPWPLAVPWSADPRSTISDGVANAGDTSTSITTRPGDTLRWNHTVRNNGPGIADTYFRIYGTRSATPWTAQYFNNINVSGTPVVTRQENVDNLQFTDYYGSPHPSIQVDGWSARWTKTENLPAGTYEFMSYSDDGMRLYVDGVLRINDWVGHGVTLNSWTGALAAGNHTIVVEYQEQGGGGEFHFRYKYLAQAWTNAGAPFAVGENRLVDGDEAYVVPLNTPSGTKICRNLVINWQDSWRSGDWFAPPDYLDSGYGQMACATVVAPQNLTPSIRIQVNGGAAAGNRAEPGDTVAFTYAVNNTGQGASSGTNCTIYGLSRTGYYTPPNPIDSASDAGFSQPAHGCPRNFPAGTNTDLVTETLSSAATGGLANRSVCRSFFVNPASPTVGSLGTEVCVHFTVKPYARTYGGDISAGGGLASSSGGCTLNTAAAIIGWNRGSANGWSGAGVQYAAYAMGRIFETATSLGNGGGSAPAPAGLSFANNSTAPASGNFGGLWETAPCIPDYYGDGPASPQPIPGSNLDSLGSGVYENLLNTYFDAPGGVTSVEPGQRTTVYVTGNLHLNSNIIYSGSWNAATMPHIRFIVKGNIYINHAVTRLDGLFIAQSTNASNGRIYTCAGNPTLYDSPSDTALYSICRNKLTINGAFVARQVRLLRTNGTTRQSAPAETGAAGAAAEVFNYNPTLWMALPAGFNAPDTYDAITSLPPIL